MNEIWSVYDSATGLFTGTQINSDEAHAMLNTPAGCALQKGAFDHLARRVDLETQSVVPWKPNRPSEDHEWLEATERWVLKPEAQEKALRAEQALARIDQLERKKLRPLGELAINSANAEARQRLESIESQLSDLRKQLA